MGWDRARRVLPYVRRLGCDGVILSPILAARAGSAHGYDVVDPTRPDPALGGEVARRAFFAQARRLGVGIVLDVVPNHQSTSATNPAWSDVLRRGPTSRFASEFDIDWTAPCPPGSRDPRGDRSQRSMALRRVGHGGQESGVVLLPLLSSSLEESFQRGEVAFGSKGGVPHLRCGDDLLPISDRSRPLLRPPRARATGTRKGRARVRAASLSLGKPAALRALNRASTRADRERRDRVLALQYYRLCSWQDPSVPNYRRFFAVNGLVGIRCEEAAVRERTHRWVLRAFRRGELTGLRVDHVDGLANPSGYLRWLRRGVESQCPQGARPPLLLVEKILARGEDLPREWPVDGTTGYDAMGWLDAVFVSAHGGEILDDLYAGSVGRSPPFPEQARRAKREVAGALFSPDRQALLRRSGLTEGAPPGPHGRSPRASEDLDRALVEWTAALPVYRTYWRPDRARPEDVTVLRQAAARARRELAPGGRHALRRLLMSSERPWADPARKAGDEEGPLPATYLRRWQQWSAAVQAKGVEDTAFFRDVRLLGRNEVGGDPSRYGISLGEFHTRFRHRARRWPRSVTATSTHDTKLGEDARGRVLVLSELAEAWARDVIRWRRVFASLTGPQGLPRRPWEKMVLVALQAVVGTRPTHGPADRDYRERLVAYLRKVAREAKEGTSWEAPVEGFERPLELLAAGLVDTSERGGVGEDLATWARTVAYPAHWYAVGRAVAKAFLPGVPMTYQGSESWNLSFVDPDNRRPVPFKHLDSELHGIASTYGTRGVDLLGQLSSTWWDGRWKLYATWRALQLRQELRDLLERGTYASVSEVELGPASRRGSRRGPATTWPVLAFSRRQGRSWLLVAIGRGLAAQGGSEGHPPVGRFWRGRGLALNAGAPGRWESLLASPPVPLEASRAEGGRGVLDLQKVFAAAPVAVLRSL